MKTKVQRPSMMECVRAFTKAQWAVVAGMTPMAFSFAFDVGRGLSLGTPIGTRMMVVAIATTIWVPIAVVGMIPMTRPYREYRAAKVQAEVDELMRG